MKQIRPDISEKSGVSRATFLMGYGLTDQANIEYDFFFSGGFEMQSMPIFVETTPF